MKREPARVHGPGLGVYDAVAAGRGRWAGWLALVLVLGGCALTPPGTKDERARMDEAGRAYDRPTTLPDLPAEPTWRDILRRAFLANGDLEAAYFNWRAAVERIAMRSAWPNSNLAPSFQYMFSDERMKSWDRTTISVGFDPAMPLSFPTKTAKAGQVALAEAQAAGKRFEAAKFSVQRQVLTAWLDYCLMAEEVRIGTETVELLDLLTQAAGARVRAGAPQQDLLKVQIEHRLAQSELESMQARLAGMRAMLNGMLGRPAGAALPPPRELPEARPVAADDAALIAMGTSANPELAALSRQVAGQANALELARMAYVPDITPMAGITGSIEKMVGAMVMLPTALPMIQGTINESRAMLRSMQAMARQTQSDRAASYVASLYAMRNAERQAKLFADVILPQARQALDASRQAYGAGAVSFVAMIDAQRTLLSVRRIIAENRTEREKQLAVMEALAGTDIETMGRASPNDQTRMENQTPNPESKIHNQSTQQSR